MISEATARRALELMAFGNSGLPTQEDRVHNAFIIDTLRYVLGERSMLADALEAVERKIRAERQ